MKTLQEIKKEIRRTKKERTKESELDELTGIDYWSGFDDDYVEALYWVLEERKNNE